MIFCINDFEGPLDLLLHLVRTSKMDITEIDTKEIIDKYLDFINNLDEIDIDDASEYLVMAAELIRLKSKLLLNIDDDDEDNDEYMINTEDDLKQKLLEYEKYQIVTEEFKKLEANRMEFFTKIPENIGQYEETKTLSCKEDANLLKEAMEEMQKRINFLKPLDTTITKKEVSVIDRTNYIRNILTKKSKVVFSDLFENFSKEVIVATFLSILEMCRDQEIVLNQEQNFGNIYIEKVN